MSIQNKGTYKDKLTLYIPKTEKEFLIPKAQKIMAREGRTLSNWFLEELQRYVTVHDPGNPQQRIDTILELGKPYNANGCMECGKKPFVLANSGKKRVLLCKTHFEKLKRKLQGWKEV